MSQIIKLPDIHWKALKNHERKLVWHHPGGFNAHQIKKAQILLNLFGASHDTVAFIFNAVLKSHYSSLSNEVHNSFMIQKWQVIKKVPLLG